MNNSKASKEGGFIYINKGLQVNILDSDFTNFYSSTKGSLVYSLSPNFKLNIINSEISCSSKPYIFGDDLSGNIDSILPYLTNAGAFYIDSASEILISYNVF